MCKLKLADVEYYTRFFRGIGLGTVPLPWLSNVNDRLDNKLAPSVEPIIFAVPIYPKHEGCSPQSLPGDAIVVRNVKIGTFSGGLEYALQYGSLAEMEHVKLYFSDGFVIATDRRFVIVSTEHIEERPYVNATEVGMVENKAIFHSCFIGFVDGNLLSMEFCFPFNNLAGLAAFLASNEGRSTTTQRVVASYNEAARQNARHIFGFLTDAVSIRDSSHKDRV